MFLLVFVFFPFQKKLTVRFPKKSGELFYARKVSVGDEFWFHYLHSVELTEVKAHFVVEPDWRLKIKETIMDSVGSGMPNDNPKRTQTLEEFRFFFVPQNKTKFVFEDEKFGSEVIDFSNYSDGVLIEVKVEGVSRFQSF